MDKGYKIILSLLSVFSIAWGSETKFWTIEDCVNYAIENNPNVRSSRENLNFTKYQNYILESEFIPKIYSNYSYTKNSKAPFGKMFNPLLNADFPPSLYSEDFYTLNLGISDTLFSWRMTPTFKLTKSNTRLANLKYNQVRNEMVYAVKKAFYSVLFASQTYRVNLQAEEVARENYETAVALYNEGKASSFDVSRAKVRWTNSKADLISARNALEVALEALKTVLSLKENESIEIKGEFKQELFERQLEEVIDEAKKNRPEIIGAKELLNIKKLSSDISKSGFLPSLQANFNYSWASSDFNLNLANHYKNWTAQLLLSIPIFDGMFSVGKYKSSKSDEKMTDLQKESIEDSVVMEVRQAYYSIKNALESLQAQKENVETAKENLNIARQRYAMGLLSHLELKDAELTLIQAEIQHIKTLYDYNIALISIEKAMGLPYR